MDGMLLIGTKILFDNLVVQTESFSVPWSCSLIQFCLLIDLVLVRYFEVALKVNKLYGNSGC